MATFQGGLPDLTKPAPEAGSGPEVYVETYGCQMNVYDSQAIEGLLERDGFQLGDNEMGADVILLNTCSVRDLAEHKVISRVGEIRHRRTKAGLPQPLIGICGCMAERLGRELRKGPRRVDLVVGVDSYDTLPGTNNSHLVTIHKGCDYKCTYCIVPYTRGPQSEKAPDTILEEIRGIVDAGGREVTLLGQNVTAYKWSDDMDFAGLIKQVSEVEGLERIRFLTGHPKDMHPHLMDAIGRLDKVCPWLHLPIQSGSDRVLRRMKRLYTSGEYLEMVDYANQVRLAELIKVQEDIWTREAAGKIGEEWTVVAEGEARRPAGSSRLRTANNRKVVVHDTSLEIGRQVRVRVTDIANTTFVGELLD